MRPDFLAFWVVYLIGLGAGVFVGWLVWGYS